MTKTNQIQITGDVVRSSNNNTGRVSALFYGPQAEEIGGTFTAGSGGTTFVGTFGGKRGDIANDFTNFTDVSASSKVRLSGDMQGGTASSGADAPDPATKKVTVVLGYDSGKKINAASITPEGSTSPTLAWGNVASDTFTQRGMPYGNVTDLASANNLVRLRLSRADWVYQTFGMWSSTADTYFREGSYGAFSVGVPTTTLPPSGLSGEVTYTGYAIGRSQDPFGNVLYVNSSMSLVIDFSAKRVTFSLTNTNTQNISFDDWSSNFANYNMSGTGTISGFDYSAGQTTMSVITPATTPIPNGTYTQSGTMKFRFYGNNAEEVGGTFTSNHTNPIGSPKSYDGSFGGKRN